jgi:excisionase family DNA binding protein
MARVFTVDEAAVYLRVTPYTVRKWLRRGRIRGSKMGRVYRIFESELEAFLRAGQVGEEMPEMQSEPRAAHTVHTRTGVPLSGEDLARDRREEAVEEERHRKLAEWKALSREEKQRRIEAVTGKYSDTMISSEELMREKHDDNAREEQKWLYREWHGLSLEQKRARLQAARGAYAHVRLSSEDLIRERREDAEREERRLRESSGQ